MKGGLGWMKNIWNDPARFLMGTIFLVTRKMVPITRQASSVLESILEKWFPFQGERAHSLLLFLYMLIERRRRRGRQNNNNSLPKVVTFFTDYKYTTSP